MLCRTAVVHENSQYVNQIEFSIKFVGREVYGNVDKQLGRRLHSCYGDFSID